MTAPALATAALDAASGQIQITEPGVYQLTSEQYHADPVPGGSLSSTGCRQLTAPSCPALFHHKRTNKQTPSDEMNLGSAAHTLALGKGDEIVIITDEDDVPLDNYKTKIARERKAEALAEGKIPLLQKEYIVVQAMAAKLREHPKAMQLLAAGKEASEQALFWKDGPVWKRALIDHMPPKIPGFRMICVDYKTCNSADPDSIEKAMYRFAYHQQADHYLQGVRALGLCQEPTFTFIFQETSAPYLVTLAQPNDRAMRIAAHLNRMATLTYAECTRSGIWPGYTEEIVELALPVWEERKYEGEPW